MITTIEDNSFILTPESGYDNFLLGRLSSLPPDCTYKIKGDKTDVEWLKFSVDWAIGVLLSQTAVEDPTDCLEVEDGT